MEEFTRKFNVAQEKDAEIRHILTTVYAALEDKGYNPINQIVGYILMELERLNITIVCGCQVQELSEDYLGFAVSTSTGVYKARKVIVACGLLAASKLGSDGSMIPLLKELGHRFVPIVPALCGFYASGMDFKKVSGVRCDAELTLDIDTNNAKASKNDRNNAENILATDNKRDVLFLISA